jgi:serine/threonine-protein kinase
MADPPDPPEPGSALLPEQPPENSGDDTPALGPDSPLPPTVPASSAVTHSEPTPAPPGAASSTFGRYEQLEPLPRGGMADVYKARDAVLKIVVALKVMKAPLADSGDEDAERFLRDVRALARLDHPNIVRVYDVGTQDGRAYFTMGFMVGGSLDRHADRFADPRAAAALVEKVARAMHYAHEQGVLHRDLKPANILLDEKGEPKVGDFGLAKIRDEDLEITRDGVVMGTYPYMAPEQARGQINMFGPATDVWALGITLYELLTRRRPFEAKSRDAIASLICTAEPPRPSTTGVELDGGLESVVLKCLEKQPKDRYASAEDLAEDLRRWQAGEPVVARRPSLGKRVWRFMRRHRAASLVVAAGLGGMLLAALLSARSLNHGSAEAKQEQIIQARREVLENVRSELARGKAVELVPPAGLPKWFRSRVGEKIDVSRADVPGADLVVRNFKLGLVELVPESPPEGFRLTADVFIANKAKGAAAGIYVASRESLAPDGVAEQWWVNLAFPCDTVPPHVTLELHRNRPGRGPKGFDTAHEVLRHELADRPWTGTWRTLGIEVRPRGIVAFWQGERIGDGGLDLLEARVADAARLHVPLPAAGRPTAERLLGGGLGLYNEEADTNFRNVRVEPLD